MTLNGHLTVLQRNAQLFVYVAGLLELELVTESKKIKVAAPDMLRGNHSFP